MAIPVTCDCGQQFEAEDYLAGKQMQCPMCGGALQIPNPLFPPGHPQAQQPQNVSSKPRQPATQQPQSQAPQQQQPPQPSQQPRPQQPAPQQPQAPQSTPQYQQPQQPQQQPAQPQSAQRQHPQQPQTQPQRPQPQRPQPQRPQQQRPQQQRPPSQQPQRQQPQQRRFQQPAQQRPQQQGAADSLGLGDLAQFESGRAIANPLMGNTQAANVDGNKWLMVSLVIGGGVLLLLVVMVVASSMQSAFRVAANSDRETRESPSDDPAPGESTSRPPTRSTTSPSPPPSSSSFNSNSGTSSGARGYSSGGGNESAPPARQYGAPANEPANSGSTPYSASPDSSSEGSGSSSAKSQPEEGGSSSSDSPTLALGLEAWHTGSTDGLRGMRRMSGKDAENEMMAYSWMCNLLPHLGHQEIHDQFDFSRSWIREPNQLMARVVIPEFLNPGDDRDRWKGYPFQGLALTHFVGMAGVEDQRNVVAATLPRSDPRAGVFGYDEVARRDDITDGASQTIAVIGSGELVSPWVQGGGATIRGARENYFDTLTGFGSRGQSSQGAVAMMADGSTRHISSDIDPAVFRALCTTHGSDTVDLQQLGEPFDLVPRKRQHSEEGPSAESGKTTIIILP